MGRYWLRSTTEACCLTLLTLAMAALVGCGGEYREGTATKKKSANAELLDEVNQEKSWFQAKRVRPIWAKELDKDQTVKTIEGSERVKAGDYLCRGDAGDIWPQTAKSLHEKYEKTEETDSGGWRKYLPRADNQGVMAARIRHAFTVHAKWGVLTGKPGDYLVKNFADRGVEYPEDVWIVDQKLFALTYKDVEGADMRAR